MLRSAWLWCACLSPPRFDSDAVLSDDPDNVAKTIPAVEKKSSKSKVSKPKGDSKPKKDSGGKSATKQVCRLSCDMKFFDVHVRVSGSLQCFTALFCDASLDMCERSCDVEELLEVIVMHQTSVTWHFPSTDVQ